MPKIFLVGNVVSKLYLKLTYLLDSVNDLKQLQNTMKQGTVKALPPLFQPCNKLN